MKKQKEKEIKDFCGSCGQDVILNKLKPKKKEGESIDDLFLSHIQNNSNLSEREKLSIRKDVYKFAGKKRLDIDLKVKNNEGALGLVCPHCKAFITAKIVLKEKK